MKVTSTVGMESADDFTILRYKFHMINSIISWSVIIIKEQTWYQNVAKTSDFHLHMIKCVLTNLHSMNIYENGEN